MRCNIRVRAVSEWCNNQPSWHLISFEREASGSRSTHHHDCDSDRAIISDLSDQSINYTAWQWRACHCRNTETVAETGLYQLLVLSLICIVPYTTAKLSFRGNNEERSEKKENFIYIAFLKASSQRVLTNKKIKTLMEDKNKVLSQSNKRMAADTPRKCNKIRTDGQKRAKKQNKKKNSKRERIKRGHYVKACLWKCVLKDLFKRIYFAPQQFNHGFNRKTQK